MIITGKFIIRKYEIFKQTYLSRYSGSGVEIFDLSLSELFVSSDLLSLFDPGVDGGRLLVCAGLCLLDAEVIFERTVDIREGGTKVRTVIVSFSRHAVMASSINI